MTYISKCDLIVYDLHSGNPEDVTLALDAMNKKRPDDNPDEQEKTIILISSLLAWDATARNLEEIRSPEDVAEEARLLKEEEEAKEKARKEFLDKEALENEDMSPTQRAELEAAQEKAISDLRSSRNEEVLSGLGSQEEIQN